MKRSQLQLHCSGDGRTLVEWFGNVSGRRVTLGQKMEEVPLVTRAPKNIKKMHTHKQTNNEQLRTNIHIYKCMFCSVCFTVRLMLMLMMHCVAVISEANYSQKLGLASVANLSILPICFENVRAPRFGSNNNNFLPLAIHSIGWLVGSCTSFTSFIRSLECVCVCPFSMHIHHLMPF